MMFVRYLLLPILVLMGRWSVLATEPANGQQTLIIKAPLNN